MRKVTCILFAITLGWALTAGVSTAAADTTVSITFDDGNADQMPAVQMLTDHDMHGTFYIIPGRVDRPNSQYMTWANVQTIFNAGNEIGGHTQNHVHLPDLDEAEQRDEICDGRDSLLARGYPQISFAYPFGDHDSTSEDLVQECGYLSGRGVGGLRDTGEPDADTIPPRNPWLLPTPGSIDVDDTLPDIKQWITDAEAAGASGHSWINLVIHHLCDPHVTDCSDPDGVDDAYITPQDFDSLLDWLQARSLTGTHVKTVEEVMTGQAPQDTTAPTSSIKCDGAACQSFYNHSVSATLSAIDNGGGSGVKNIRYTTDGSNPTASSPVYSSAIPVNSTTTIKWRAEDNAGNVESIHSQTISIDSAKPTSSIQCNATACQSSFYNASVSATLSGSDAGGSGLKNIRYTTNGSDPTGSSTIYSGPINLAATTTIKWRAEDNAGNVESPIQSQTISVDTAKPTSSIQCNGSACSSGFYNAAVSATLSGSDTGGSGVKNIRYTTDGSNPTGSSTTYSGAIPVSSTTTIKWRAEDNAGNVESPVHSQTIQVDTAKPTSSILCDGSACSSSYDHAVQATFSGGDSGGSGLNGIRYTTDNSTPNGTSPLYVPGSSSPITVGSTTTIKFVAQDKAGNLESPVHSQTITITIDAASPTSSILCDGAACQASYDHPIEATLSATDTDGSGVKEIRYTTDGSDPTSSSPLYSSPIDIDSTTTIRWRAEDNAGNVEPANSQTIEITSSQPPPPPGETPSGTGGTLGAFFSSKSLPNGTVKLVLDVSGPGELRAVDGVVAGTSAATAKKRRAWIKPTSKSVAQAGEVTLVLRTTKAGKRILSRRGKLKVPVHVTFTPLVGAPSELTPQIKFRITLNA